MAFDSHKNFAYGTIATAPSPATSGTSLVVTGGQGAGFPTPPFNATIWPSGVQPLASNAEIVRVTNISTDTFTITRTQESTSARTVVVGDQIAAAITVQTITDIEAADALKATLASPQLTGHPKGVTESNNDNSTNLATTAYADAGLSIYEKLMNGSNRNIKFTWPRVSSMSATNGPNPSSGVMHAAAIVLEAGQVVTNISFRVGGTGATLGSNNDSHWWVALYDTASPANLLSQSADQTTASLLSGSVKTLALSTNGGAQTIATTGVYYIAFMLNFGTGGVPVMCNLLGQNLGNTTVATGFTGTMPLLALQSGSGLTTTATGTLASPSSAANMGYYQTS